MKTSLSLLWTPEDELVWGSRFRTRVGSEGVVLIDRRAGCRRAVSPSLSDESDNCPPPPPPGVRGPSAGWCRRLQKQHLDPPPLIQQQIFSLLSSSCRLLHTFLSTFLPSLCGVLCFFLLRLFSSLILSLFCLVISFILFQAL